MDGFVGLVSGAHSPPHRPVMGLNIGSVDAASFQRVVNLRQGSPVHHVHQETKSLLLYEGFSVTPPAGFVSTLT